MNINETDTDTAQQETTGQAAAEEIQQQTGPTPEDELRSGLETLAGEQAGKTTEEQPSGEKAQTQEDPTPASTETETGKPGEAEAAAAAEQTAENENEDSFLDSLPEDNPTPDHWKQMREQYKALKKAAKEAEASAEQRQAQQQQAAPPQPQFAIGQQAPQALEKKYGADFLVETLAKINAGDLGEEYRQEAETYLARTISPSELRQVMERAKQGGFGELSTDILDVAKEQLPVVLASAEENRSAQMQAARYEQMRQQAWKETVEAYPGIEDVKTENGKKFAGALQELSQAIPGIHNLPNAIRIVRDFVELRTAASERDTLKAEKQRLETELKVLREKHGIITSPQKGGDSTNSNRTLKTTPEAELVQNLANLGVGTT